MLLRIIVVLMIDTKSLILKYLALPKYCTMPVQLRSYSPFEPIHSFSVFDSTSSSQYFKIRSQSTSTKSKIQNTNSKLNKVHKIATCIGEHCETSDPKPLNTTNDETTEVEDVSGPVKTTAIAETLSSQGLMYCH